MRPFCRYVLIDVALESPTVQQKRDHRIIRSRHFHKMQRRHFIIFDVLPFIGTLVALGLLFYRPIGMMEFSLFFGFWLITGLGLTEGANDETKRRYAFVFGDFRRIHRTGIISVHFRAAEWRHKEVELAAHELLQLLDRRAGIA